MMNKTFCLLFLTVVFVLLQACNSTPMDSSSLTPALELTVSATPTSSPTVMLVPASTFTNTPTATPSSTSTLIPSSTATKTPHPTPTQSDGNVDTEAIIIDHNSIELFDKIPEEYITEASKLRWLHRHASVGSNMRFGLDCLANYFPDRPDPARRPFSCDKDINSAEIVFDSKYDSTNWIFEPHALPNPNPGWYNKTKYFIERIDNLDKNENFNFASYNMGYVEDQTINDHFFSNTNPDDDFPSVLDLENLELRHPDITVIWWTIALARQTDPHILDFNQNMRDYALENQKILMDIADIESHRPDGTPCTGIDTTENPTNLTAICPEYVNEVFAGHLNAYGRTRMAKAIWVMMAMLAGWDGNSP